MKITLLCVEQGGGTDGPTRPLSPRRAATSYFIPRLHNRLFVSRFYPRSESHPAPFPCERRAATFLPTWDRTGRRIRGDGEKVPRGYRKPSCPPPPSLNPFPSISTLPPSRARFVSEHLFVVRALPLKTARPKSTGNELRLRDRRTTYPGFYLPRLTLNLPNM